MAENKLLLDVPKPQNVDKRVFFKFDYSTTGSQAVKWRERHEAKKLWKVQVHAGKLQQNVSYCSMDLTRSSTSPPVDAARMAETHNSWRQSSLKPIAFKFVLI